MRHCDAELLAGYALGDTAELSDDDRRHLEVCDECQAEVRELRLLVEGLPLSTADELVSPRAEVWERIQAELRDELPGAQSRPEQTSAPQTSAQQMSTQPSPETNVVALDRTRRARPDRRWILRAVAAAVIGVLLGVVGTVTLRDGTTEQVQVLARTVLEPLPGKTGSGSAELVTIDHQPFLRITVKGLGAGAGYHELWLINSDGKRMVSLGVLPENTTKTYPLPAGLGSSYRIVDVSLEPDDGNPLHSHNSLVRGTLPL